MNEILQFVAGSAVGLLIWQFVVVPLRNAREARARKKKHAQQESHFPLIANVTQWARCRDCGENPLGTDPWGSTCARCGGILEWITEDTP